MLEFTILNEPDARYGKENKDEFLLDLKMRLAKELLNMDMPKEKIIYFRISHI